jgi:hypothetical protein
MSSGKMLVASDSGYFDLAACTTFREAHTAATLPHRVDLASNGVMINQITWCCENCQGGWGWFFVPDSDVRGLRPGMFVDLDKQTAYMAFEDSDDAFLFKLACG